MTDFGAGSIHDDRRIARADRRRCGVGLWEQPFRGVWQEQRSANLLAVGGRGSEFCIKMDEFCIQNDDFFVFQMMNSAGSEPPFQQARDGPVHRGDLRCQEEVREEAREGEHTERLHQYLLQREVRHSGAHRRVRVRIYTGVFCCVKPFILC